MADWRPHPLLTVGRGGGPLRSLLAGHECAVVRRGESRLRKTWVKTERSPSHHAELGSAETHAARRRGRNDRAGGEARVEVFERPCGCSHATCR